MIRDTITSLAVAAGPLLLAWIGAMVRRLLAQRLYVAQTRVIERRARAVVAERIHALFHGGALHRLGVRVAEDERSDRVVHEEEFVDTEASFIPRVIADFTPFST